MNKRLIHYLLVLLVLGGAGGWFALQMLRSQENPPKSGAPNKGNPGFQTLVVVTEIERREVHPMQEILGTVKPTRSSKVGSAASGRIEEFCVDEGKFVESGAIIAKLRTGVIEAEVAAAEATYKAREAEWQKLKSSWDIEKERAQAALKKKEAMLEYFAAKRKRAIKAPGTISAEEFEELLALEKEQQESVKESQAALKLLDEPMAKEIAKAEAVAKSAKAEWDRLHEQLQRHTIRAPFDGYIVAEYTEEGEWVLQGGLVASIAELEEAVDIEVPVLEDYKGYLQVGDKVAVDVPALPGRKFTGTVQFIVPQAIVKARTVPVKIRVANQKHGKSVLLMAGMTARVKLPVGFKQQALLVPRDALVLSGRETKVFVVDPDPKDPGKGIARSEVVELGVSQGDRVQIIGNVKAGQFVVIRGNERLREGQPVVIRRKKDLKAAR